MDLGVEVIGVSRDLAPSQNKFKETVGAKNFFLSDMDAVVMKRYGAFNPQSGIARRYYYLIDEGGKLIWKNTTGQLVPAEKLVEDLTAAVKK